MCPVHQAIDVVIKVLNIRTCVILSYKSDYETEWAGLVYYYQEVNVPEFSGRTYRPGTSLVCVNMLLYICVQDYETAYHARYRKM